MNYTKNPGYIDLVADTYTAIKYYYREENWKGYTFPQGFLNEFLYYYHFPIKDSYPIVYIGLLFTLVRYIFELFICKVNSVNQSIFCYLFN